MVNLIDLQSRADISLEVVSFGSYRGSSKLGLLTNYDSAATANFAPQQLIDCRPADYSQPRTYYLITRRSLSRITQCATVRRPSSWM